MNIDQTSEEVKFGKTRYNTLDFRSAGARVRKLLSG